MSVIVKEEWNQKEYLVARLEEQECLDEDCLASVGSGQDSGGEMDKKGETGTGMNAGIEGILPISYNQFMETRVLRYDINAYVSFAEYKKQIKDGDALCRVFQSILDTYALAESYLLEPAYFLLEQEYIYIKPETGKAWLVLCPVYSEADDGIAQNGNLADLFRSMLKGIRLADKDMAFYGKLTYELDNGESFNRVTFRRFLTEAGSSAGHQTKREKPEMAANTAEGDETIHGGYPPKAVTGENPLDPPQDFRSSKKKENGGFLKEIFGGKSEKSEKSHKTEKAVRVKKESGKEKANSKKRSGGILLPDEENLPIGFGTEKRSEKSEDFEEATREDREKRGKRDKGRKDLKGREGKTGRGAQADAEIIPVVLTDDDEIPSTDDELPDKNHVRRKLFLKRSDTGESIPVTFFPFEIGREGSGLRVELSKTKVSRKHAVINDTEEGYVIRDFSKLGTFLDGERIPKETDMRLENGMTLSLKEIEYAVIIEE